MVTGEGPRDVRLQSANEVATNDLRIDDIKGSVVVLEPGALSSVDGATLRALLLDGQPVIALDTPLSELVAATGFDKATGEPSDGLPTAADGMFSYVWVSYNARGDIAHTARGQQDLEGPYLEAQLRQFSLLARGEIELIDGDGEVIPLEDYR